MTKEDIRFLKLDAEWMYERYERYLDCENNTAFAMEDEIGLLCAFGCAFLWDGVCETWFNLIRKEKTITQIRTIKRYIEEQSKKLNICRMHSTVKCTSLIGIRFVEKLGFHCETPCGMKSYNPNGSDAFLYSYIPEQGL